MPVVFYDIEKTLASTAKSEKMRYFAVGYTFYAAIISGIRRRRKKKVGDADTKRTQIFQKKLKNT